MASIPYTVLVNSCDHFEDTWIPFFTLFSKYWQPSNVEILLVTERKQFEFPGLNIRCSFANRTESRRLTWSECLSDALKQVKTPLVVYFQDDYFLEKPVDLDTVNRFATAMVLQSSTKHVGLTHFGSQGPFEPSDDPDLWTIERNDKYRISTQVGLWQVATLQSYLRPDENGWMFEIFGSRRASKRNENFLTVNRDKYSAPVNSLVQYTHTGIIKGKWHPAMKGLFEREKIEMDFSQRGFYQPKSPLLRKIETIRALTSNPIRAAKGMLGL